MAVKVLPIYKSFVNIPLLGDKKWEQVCYLCCMIRLGIIEDDAGMRQTLVNFFDETPGMDCLIQADSVEGFVNAWKSDLFLDIVLSDIGLPGLSGIQGTPMIRKRAPECQILILTVFDDADSIFSALRAGASGYVSKRVSLSKIKEAVQTIYDGGAYMSPGIARKITDLFNPVKKGPQQILTPREEQVVHAIEAGLHNKEIAAQLSISPETVKSHIKQIYLKLDINNRMDIVRGKYK